MAEEPVRRSLQLRIVYRHASSSLEHLYPEPNMAGCIAIRKQIHTLKYTRNTLDFARTNF